MNKFINLENKSNKLLKNLFKKFRIKNINYNKKSIVPPKCNFSASLCVINPLEVLNIRILSFNEVDIIFKVFKLT